MLSHMKLLRIAALAAALPLLAQKFEYWPGARYDPATPTVEKVVGFPAGERLASHAKVVQYFEALAAANPGRMKVFEYGKTWEGRRLIYAAIGSEANIRRLSELKASVQKLADPRKTPQAEAARLMENMPAIINLSYGVHGNEISSPDAAMMTAYHLLASRGDKMIDEIFQNLVILIDPLQNPDGRDRFVHNFEINEGLEPDANPVTAEHTEPWPGGRTNHYYFDMNRDWFAMTQPETRGRIKYVLEWLPLVFVDLHEVGTENTYFFSPGAAPYNPNLTKEQKDQMYWFGKNNAKWFDQFGFTYFTREVYDEFYPGYGASWPWYYGGMGMTYENASVRGLLVRRSDDTVYTFRDSVRKHFVASVSTCEAAARNRKRLLENFYNYQVTALAEGAKETPREYIFPRRGDTSALDKMIQLLVDQGVEVQRASASFKNAGKEYPAGTYVISSVQPRKRFLRAVLDPNNPMEPDFLKEQERRRKRRLPDQIYDVTAWSLPHLYNVEMETSAEASQGSFAPVSGQVVAPGKVSGKAEVAYLVPWGTQAAGRFLTGALRADLRVLSANKAFTQGDRKYPAGTLIVMVKQNPATVHETVGRVAASSGADVVATNSSWVDDGVDFGSSNTIYMRKPVIAMLWDQPTSGASAGQTRFVLERQYGYPVSVIRSQNIGNADLSKINVLILPDAGFGGGYANTFAGANLDRLKSWVRSGGVIVGIGGALGFLSDPRVGLLALTQENQPRRADAPKPAAGGGSGAPSAATGAAPGPGGGPPARVPGQLLTKQEDFERAIQPDSELPDAVAGVMVRVKVDPELWLTAGVAPQLYAVVAGRTIYSPIKIDRGVNAAYFAGPDELLAGGYIWEENRKQLAYKPFVVAQQEGRGMVVGFTADPNYRAYMDGLNVMFLNAVFRSAGMSRPGAAAEELREEHD